MIGEKIGGISGKITMQRVLANLGGAPKMETSFQASGSLLGIDLKDTGTYWTVVRHDGTHYGEGQGVMITKDGKMATWTGQGVGTMKKDGSATYRGAIYLQSLQLSLKGQELSVCRSKALRLWTTISGARCASRSSFSSTSQFGSP